MLRAVSEGHLVATEVAERYKMPFVTGSVADKLTERGFKYTFRPNNKAVYDAKEQLEAIKTLTQQYTGWRRHWARARLVLSHSLISFFQEDSLTVSASIAYHAILSLFPLMLLLVAIGGVFIGRYELSGQLTVLLGRYLPMKPDFILKNLASISHSFGRITVVSILLLLWSSA